MLPAEEKSVAAQSLCEVDAGVEVSFAGCPFSEPDSRDCVLSS